MGGYGSGRRATRVAIEGQRRLDVRQFRKRGALGLGRSCTWTWSQYGEAVGSAAYQVLDGAVELNYTVGDDDGKRIPIQVIVQLRVVPCRARAMDLRVSRMALESR